jgi:hypothetical protein
LTRLARALGFIAAQVVATDAGRAQAPIGRDSAGVRIIDNPSRLSAPITFSLGSAPVFDVGGAEIEPSLEFHHKQGYLRGVPLSRGGFAVIDVFRVHVFNDRSARVRVVGRQGNGPLEFLYLTAICRTRGDTVLVGDGNSRRLAVLDETTRIIRTIAMRDLGSPPFDFCFDDGTFVLQRWVGEMVGGVRQLRLSRIRADGSVANVIAVFPARVIDVVTQAEVAVVAAGKRLYYGDGESNEVRVYSARGGLLRIIRTSDKRTRITDTDIERRLAVMVPVSARVSASARTKQLERLRAMPHASHWPAFGRIHVDPAGRLWVQDYRMSYPAPDGWTVFDPAGRVLGRLILPAPQSGSPPEVVGFGVRSIYVKRYDADGGLHLTEYPVRQVGGRH